MDHHLTFLLQTDHQKDRSSARTKECQEEEAAAKRGFGGQIPVGRPLPPERQRAGAQRAGRRDEDDLQAGGEMVQETHRP